MKQRRLGDGSKSSRRTHAAADIELSDEHLNTLSELFAAGDRYAPAAMQTVEH